MGAFLLLSLGCASLGIVAGGLIGHYVASTKEFTLRALASVLSLVGGASVIGIFKFLGGGDPGLAAWWYPIGILIGLGGIASLHFGPAAPAKSPPQP